MTQSYSELLNNSIGLPDIELTTARAGTTDPRGVGALESSAVRRK